MAFSSRIRTFASLFSLTLLMGVVVPQIGFGQIYVSNYSQLYSAILSTQTTTGAVEIVITNSITLEGELPTIGGGTSGNVTISADPNASGQIAINGDSQYRGFFIDVDSSIVEITGLRFDSCVATGGNGGDGAVAGGGGAGLGGAIYVKDGNVTLTDVAFKDNAALGGNGGTVVSDSTTIGGGGGMGGHGGSGAVEGADRLGQTGDRNYAAAGGGGFGRGADGGDASDSTANNGQDGIAAETTFQGGKAYSSEKEPTAGLVGLGGNQGGGGAGSYGTDKNSTSSGGGGGIIDTTDTDNPYNNATSSRGGNGGYGGGGGGSTKLGGDGGFGGGGGAGGDKNYIPGPGERIGGDGGFGGGGGGAYSEPYVGLGGIGAGKGGTQGELYNPQLSQTTQAGGTGGGGLGAGGAVFVQNGSLTINYTQEYYDEYSLNHAFNGNTSEGGLGGGGTAGDGNSLGSGIFMLHGTTSINTLSGNVLRISDNIDGVAAASNIDWDDPGIFSMIRTDYYGKLNVAGDGTLELRGDNTITSLVNIDTNATLLANSDAGSALGEFATVEVDGVLKLQKDETIGYLEGAGEVHLFHNNGTSNVGGRTLTIAGNEDPSDKSTNPLTGTAWGVFSGSIVTDGDAATRERLIKTGTGRLILDGDNRNTGDEFETTIYQGTIEVRSDEALGGGDIVSKNVDFGTGVNLRNSLEAGTAGLTIANKIRILTEETIDGQKVQYNGFVVGGENLTLSGQITGGALIVNMKDANTTLELANIDPNNANRYGETRIYRGTVIVNDIPAGTDTPQSNSLGTGTIRLLEGGQGGINAKNGVNITQNIHIDNAAGQFLLGNVAIGDNYEISGNITGQGGITVNLNDVSDELTLSGNNTYTGVTNITQGTVVLVRDTTLQGGLSGGNNATLNAGNKNLTIGGRNSSMFSGTIANVSSLLKTGTGTWTYNGTAVLPKITVTEGGFQIGSNAAGADAVTDVALGGSGELHLTDDTILKNLSAASSTNVVFIDNHKLTLQGNDGQEKFYAAFKGTGTVVFDPATSTTWNLYGLSSAFSGTVDINADATVNANWFNALGDGTTTVNLNGGTLGVDVAGYYGIMQIGTLNVTAAGTLDIADVSFTLMTTNLNIDNNGTLTKTGNGYLTVTGDNSSLTVNETIDLQEGGIWLAKTSSTNSTTYDASLGNATINVSGGNTGLNFELDPTGVTKTVSNEITMDSGSRLTFIANDGNLKWDGNLSSTDQEATITFSGTADKILTGNHSGFSGNLIASGGSLGLQSNAITDLQNASLVVKNGASLSGVNGTTLKNMTFESGSTLYVDMDANPGGTTFVVDGGNLTIQNDAVAYFYTNGASTAGDFTLIDATSASSYTGDFSLIDDVLGKRAVAEWNGNKYEVSFVDVSFMDAATTSGQRAVAAYLTHLAENDDSQAVMALSTSSISSNAARSPELNHLLNVVESLSVNTRSYAYDELSGEIYNSIGVAQIQTTSLNFMNLAENLRMINSVSGNTALNQHVSSANGLNTGEMIVRGKSCLSSGWTGWTAFSGNFGSASSRKGYHGYDYKNSGGIVALEPTASGSARFGIYYAYNYTDINTDRTIGFAHNSDHLIGLYARWLDSCGYTSVIGGIGIDDYGVGRTVMSGTTEQAYLHDSFGGWQGGLYVERGLPLFEIAQLHLQPYFGLQYIHLTRNSIEESGPSVARLIGGNSDMDSLRTNLGVRMIHDFQTSRGNLQLEGNVSWMHELADANMISTFRFAGANAGAFQSTGNGLGRDWVLAGVGANLALSDRFSLIGGYDLMFNEYQTLHTATGGFMFAW